jgi:hypothetical protein
MAHLHPKSKVERCSGSRRKQLARPERFELPTYCSGGNRSIQLSYGRGPFLSIVYATSSPFEMGFFGAQLLHFQAYLSTPDP